MPKTISKKKRLEAVIAQRITPLFALDQGSCELVRVDGKNGKVQVRLGGSYRGSPCRETLIKYVVEPILKKEVEDIRVVEWID
ncbi:MAG: hypothetical protein GY847_08450 [Proteobacteria bacterium]|nr:hypothetical protein [Pseudomonadota bacterium]